MTKKLKRAIFEWLYNHENTWLRLNECVKAFRKYIYTDDGEFDDLAGGRKVYEYIKQCDALLYGADDIDLINKL